MISWPAIVLQFDDDDTFHEWVIYLSDNGDSRYSFEIDREYRKLQEEIKNEATWQGPEMSEKYNRKYSEQRTDSTYEASIVEESETHVKLVITINGIMIYKRMFQKVSFNIDNIFYREVGKIHLGFYDTYITKNDGEWNDKKKETVVQENENKEKDTK